MNIHQSFKYQLLHNRDGQSSSCQWADLRLHNRTRETLTRAVKELCCLAAGKAATAAIGSDRKATALTVLSEPVGLVGAGGSLHLKETHKNTTQVFIWCKLLLQCTADGLWQEFCSTLQCIAAWSPARVVTDGRPFLPLLPGWLWKMWWVFLKGLSNRYLLVLNCLPPPPSLLFSSVLRVLLLGWGIIFNPREKHSALVSKLIENGHLSSCLSSEHFMKGHWFFFFSF